MSSRGINPASGDGQTVPLRHFEPSNPPSDLAERPPLRGTRGSHESSAVSRQPSVAAVQNVGGQHSDTGSNRLQALIGSLHRPSSGSNQRILVIAQPVKPELNPPHNELGSRGWRVVVAV